MIINEDLQDTLLLEFNEVWSYYPRKQGKKLSQKRYCKLRRDYTKEEIIQAIAKYIDNIKGVETKYIKQV